ncbi:MAG: hypothetical protein JW997_01455 [Actinobacteria bacterium]|nr:hypothetical protein [Actinomycetota bacterium]
MENRKAFKRETSNRPFFFSTFSVAAFSIGIISIITPGFGFYSGIIAIMFSLTDISRELFIFDKVKGIGLDLCAIVMGLYGIMEMFF